MPGYFESQKQKLKEKFASMKKFNQRGMSDDSCHSPTQPSKEGVDVLVDINANLNSNKANSTPIFQSQQWTKKDETSNPIKYEHSKAKRRPKKYENACSQTCPMMEAAQQPC